MDNPLRIVGLRAENVKRLRAVEIEPDPHFVVIGGRNGQGKTSLLDSIWWALAGKDAQKDSPRPVRDGETYASVTVDLGDLVVERTWRAGEQTLVVKSADGSKLRSPQAILDALTGEMGFDPLKFTQLHPKNQRDTLLSLIELPFDLEELDEIRRAAYDERTDRNRQLKSAEARLAGLPVVTIPDNAPSLAEAMADQRKASADMMSNRTVRAEWHRRTTAFETAQQRLEEAKAAVAAALDIEAHTAAAVNEYRPMFDGLQDDPDLVAFEARVGDAEHWASVRAEQQRRGDIETEIEDLTGNLAELQAHLDGVEQTKRDGIAAAKMPVDGLGLDDDNALTFQGVPLSQASQAEKLRVATAIAMAMNPRIRVIIVNNASLLDDDNLGMMAQMAAEHDFQVWVEVIGDGEGAIVIEDGQVVG